MPIATTFRRAHLFDANHPCYAGDLGIGPNPKLLARVQNADLIVLIGGRLGEQPSQGYTLIDIPAPADSCMYFPGWRSWGVSIGRNLRSMRRQTPLLLRLRGSSRRRFCGGAIERSWPMPR